MTPWRGRRAAGDRPLAIGVFRRRIDGELPEGARRRAVHVEDRGLDDEHEARPRVAFGMAGNEATLKTGADLRAPAAGPSPSWPRPSAHSLRKKLPAAPTSRLTRSPACVRFEVSQQ